MFVEPCADLEDAGEELIARLLDDTALCKEDILEEGEDVRWCSCGMALSRNCDRRLVEGAVEGWRGSDVDFVGLMKVELNSAKLVLALDKVAGAFELGRA